MVLALVTVLTACIVPSRDATYSYTVEYDVEYGRGTVDGGGGSTGLALDLYVPDIPGDVDLPLMVMIHGGGFTGGSKSNGNLVASAEEYAARGHLVASIDYRLLGDDPVPSDRVQPLLDSYGSDPAAIIVAIAAAVDDTLTALDFLQARDDVNASWTTLWGSSAGAITALIAGYALDDHGIERPPVAAVIDLWGGFFGSSIGTPFDDPTGDDPVLYVVHGTDDTVVPFAQAEDIERWAAEAGLPHEYFPIAGAGHGVDMFANDASPGVSLFQRSVDWLGETVFENRPAGPLDIDA